MKILRIGVFLILISLSVSAQTTVSLSFAPVDLGVGVRIDQQMRDNGVYFSALYGNYAFCECYIKDHVKVSAGMIFTSPIIKGSYLTAGICLHRYGRYRLPDLYPYDRVLCPLSYEVGAGTKLGRINVAFRIDPHKWDSAIDIGFTF